MGTFKYKAFISYSHKDRQWAHWLHRRLERYKVPKHMIGQQTVAGRVPENLRPIFRDQEELTAGHSLGEKIETALSQSEALIIVCSPNAARSNWVNQEILFFKRNNRHAKIFSVIVDGEPFAADLSDPDGQECLPEALRYEINDSGTLSNHPAEPLAADLRATADGKRLGTLKLISGIVGLGLDDLVQRDLQRARKRVTAITSTALAVVLVMATLTGFALDARREADAQRNDAEGLIEFMLTDLRDKMEPVGRLDILDDVALESLSYFEKQDSASLSCAALSGKARAHYLRARTAFDRKRMKDAEDQANIAVEIMERENKFCYNDPKFIISYAHAVQWAAEPIFESFTFRFHELSDKEKTENFEKISNAYYRSKLILEQLIEISNQDFQYDYETSDADILIGKLFHTIGNIDESIAYFRAAHDRLSPYTHNPSEFGLSESHYNNLLDKYADALSWMGSAYEEKGELEKALSFNSEYRNIYDKLSKSKDGLIINPVNRYHTLGADYTRSRIAYKKGDLEESISKLRQISPDSKCLADLDQSNKSWRELSEKIERTIQNLQQSQKGN